MEGERNFKKTQIQSTLFGLGEGLFEPKELERTLNYHQYQERKLSHNRSNSVLCGPEGGEKLVSDGDLLEFYS